MAEKGHQFAEVKSRVEELPGGPKLVKVVFDVNEGPKVKVRDIEFVGNDAVSDGTLKRKMKETKEHWFLSWITGRGTYQEAKFEEDAEKRRDLLPRAGLRPGARRHAGDQDARRLAGQGNALGAAAHSGHRRPALPRRRGQVRRQQGRQDRVPAAALQAEAGRVLLGEERPQGLREGARDLRRRRLLRVHRVSRTCEFVERGRGPGRRAGASRPSTSRCGCRKASSTSSTASPSPATRRRATTSSAARCGWSKAASSAPKR